MTPLLTYSLLNELEQLKDKELPPIHLWDPQHVSDVDLEIGEDGTWYHEGAAIKRQRLVRLFSTLLRRDADGQYYLVTPVEKCLVRVKRAPFMAVLMTATGAGKDQQLTFTTNVADNVTVDTQHPMVFRRDDSGVYVPLVEVRDGLLALVDRNVYYELMDLVTCYAFEGEDFYGFWCGGVFYPMQLATEVNNMGAAGS
jgi:hypothetical protein